MKDAIKQTIKGLAEFAIAFSENNAKRQVLENRAEMIRKEITANIERYDAQITDWDFDVYDGEITVTIKL